MVCHHDGVLLLISTFLIKKKKFTCPIAYTILLLVYFVLRLDLATLPNLVLSSLVQRAF